MRGNTVQIICLSLGLLVASSRAEPADMWVSSDMGAGGYMNQVRAGPSGIILANSDLSGSYISRDRGKSWSCIGAAQGLRETHCCGLGFDPRNPSVMFLGTDGGIYRSDNAGRSFVKVFENIFCTDIQISPRDPMIGYASGTSRFNRNDAKVYKTTDNGKTWKPISTNLPPSDCIIEDMTIAAANPDLVFAHAYDGRFAKSINALFKSADGGVTWTELGKDSLGGDVFDYAVSPADARIIFASGPKLGVVKSTDGGTTWNNVKTKVYGSLFIKADQPNIVRLLANWNAFESEDAGKTWMQIATWPEGLFLPGHPWGGPDCTRKCDDLSDSDAYYWRNSCWVWGSFDGGKTPHPLWTDQTPPGSGKWRTRGMENANAAVIEISPADSNVVYAGFWDMGMWRSLDHGATWESCNNTQLTGAWKTSVDDKSPKGCGGNTMTIAADPTRPGVVWATIGGDQGTPQVLYKNNNFGQYDSWVRSDHGLPTTSQVFGLSIDDHSPTSNRTLFITANGNIYRSTDDGANWSQVSHDIRCSCTRVDQHNPATVYAGGASGIYASTDDGTTWRSIGSPETTGVSDVSLDPSDRQTIYVACSGGRSSKGLYRTRDGGATWQRILQDRFLRTVAVDPKNPRNIYAGSSSAFISGGYHPDSNGALMSRDGGSTWKPINEGLSWPFVSHLALDPKDPSCLFACAPGQGIEIRHVGGILPPGGQ